MISPVVNLGWHIYTHTTEFTDVVVLMALILLVIFKVILLLMCDVKLHVVVVTFQEPAWLHFITCHWVIKPLSHASLLSTIDLWCKSS